MKRQILLLAMTAAALSSCTTAYKTGQTPDDVYYSPARPQDEYVRVEEKDEYRYDDNYYHNRYCRNNVIAYHPGVGVAQQNVPKPRNFNIASYTNTNYNVANSNVNMRSYKSNAGRPVYNNSNSGNGLSNSLKTIFNGNNNSSNNNSNSSPSRSYTPTNSNSG